MFKDYYAILDVSPGASGEEIRRAFRRLALLVHPDKLAGTLPVIAVGTMTAAWHTTNGPASASGSTLPPLPTLVGDAPVHGHVADVPALACSFSQPAKDFTDIQEAYEVLGDVARRYLYDMNYKELQTLQLQNLYAEQQRREAHVRAVAEASRQAHERERLRQEKLQRLSSFQHGLSSVIREEARGVDVSSSAAATASAGPSPSLQVYTNIRGERGFIPPCPLSSATHGLPPTHRDVSHDNPASNARGDGGDCMVEDIEDVMVGSCRETLPSNHETASSMAQTVGGRDCGVHEDLRGDSKEAQACFSSSAPPVLQTRISSPRKKKKLPGRGTAAPPKFSLSNPLPLQWGENAAQTCPSVAVHAARERSTWHRRGTPDESVRNLPVPIEYYHQRAIQRTLEVFFGVLRPE